MSTQTEHTEHDRMDPADDLLEALLAEGWTHRRIASFCGISTKTIQRRLKDEDFARGVSLLRRQRLSETISRIRRITDKAVDVLDEAMDDEDVKVRMRAATAALDYQERYHRRAIFEADVDERISNLETAHEGESEAAEGHVGDPQVASLARMVIEGLPASEQTD